MVTIKQIAELAGVSRGTVDRVLNHRGRVAPEKEALIKQLVEQLHYQPSETGRALAAQRSRQQVLFFAVESKSHPFFADINVAARLQAANLERLGMDTLFREHWMQKTAVEMQQELAQTPHSGLILPGLEIPALKTAAQWAAERSLPVVYYNEPPRHENYLAYVGCDYVQAGRLAAGLCALTGSGEIGIISEGLQAAHSFTERIRGFHQALQAYPHLKVTDVCDLEHSVHMLQQHPEMCLIYLVNPGDYYVCRQIHALRPEVRIITNDLTDAPRQLLQEGILTATITQDPSLQGSLPLELLYQFLFLQQRPTTPTLYTELRIHIREMC